MKGFIRIIGFFALAAVLSLSSCKNGGDNAGIDEQGKVIEASVKDGGNSITYCRSGYVTG